MSNAGNPTTFMQFKTACRKISTASSASALWFTECLKHPTKVGAISPSSKALGDAMASFVPADKPGYVLELGSGTGAITKCLLDSGISPDRLIAVERAPHLAKYLQKRFPLITVLNQDVLTIEENLNSECQIAAIVSGLPLKSLPSGVVDGVVELSNRLLKPSGGSLIQFTYALTGRSPYVKNGQFFEASTKKFVWLNLPPARVDVFKAL